MWVWCFPNHIDGILVCIVTYQGFSTKIKWDKVELIMCFIEINGGKERGECAWLFWGRWHGLSIQVGQTSSLAPEIYQVFFNKGIDKEDKDTHILIITVKVAPSVMMGWDGIKTDCTKNTRVSYVNPERRRWSGNVYYNLVNSTIHCWQHVWGQIQ